LARLVPQQYVEPLDVTPHPRVDRAVTDWKEKPPATADGDVLK
jgi:hypothetical protein